MRDWRGLATFVLAVALGVGWAGGLLYALSPRTPPASADGLQLIASIGGGLVVILASYIGGRRHDCPPGDDDPPENPPT